MYDTFDATMVLSLISSLFSLFIFVFFLLKSRKSALTTSFLIYLILVFLYPLDGVAHNILIAFRVYGQEYHWWICRTLQYFTISYIGTSFLVFCIHYTVSNKKISRVSSILLFMISTILFFAVLFRRYDIVTLNDLYEEMFWYKTITLFALMVAGIIILFISHAGKTGYEKKQSALLLASISIPLAVIMLQAYLKVSSRSDPFWDNPALVPVSFTISCLMIAISTIKYRFLNLSAVASKKIHENMKDAFIAIDNSGVIIDMNQPLALMFPKHAGIKRNGDAAEFYQALAACAAPGPGPGVIMDNRKGRIDVSASTEITLNSSERKSYLVSMQPIILNRSDCIGSIFSFSDITAYKSLLTELNANNAKLTETKSELTQANMQLREHASMVEQLAVVRERNRLAREIHDSLGHTLTLLLTLLKASQITLQQNPEDTGGKLEEAVEITRNGLKELKRSIVGISQPEGSRQDLVQALDKLAREAGAAGTRVDVAVNGSNATACGFHSDIVYKVCREAVTNSIRHGKASSISIVVCFIEDATKLLIIDDGAGCGNFEEGFGLAGMRQSIEGANGKIEYGSGEEGGFSIYAEIPLNDNMEQGMRNNA